MKCLFSFSPERDDDTVAAATLTEFQRRKIKHLGSVSLCQNGPQASDPSKIQISDKFSIHCPRTLQLNGDKPWEKLWLFSISNKSDVAETVFNFLQFSV